MYGVKAHLCRRAHASCGQMKHVGPVRSPFQGDLGRWCRPTGSDAAAAPRQKPLWTLILQCMYVYVSYVCACISMYAYVSVCIICICMYCMYLYVSVLYLYVLNVCVYIVCKCMHVTVFVCIIHNRRMSRGVFCLSITAYKSITLCFVWPPPARILFYVSYRSFLSRLVTLIQTIYVI